MILQAEAEDVFRLLPERHVCRIEVCDARKNDNKNGI